MDSSTQTPDTEAATAPRRKPFANPRLVDIHWILLKPVFKGRQLTHPERLARVCTYQERLGTFEVYRLDVQLDGEAKPEQGNLLEVMVDHRNRRVRFGPHDSVRMTPTGRGLAGYLLSRLVDWVQRNCQDYHVTPVPLNDADPADESRLARNRLLQRAGFELHYVDESAGIGRAQVGEVSGLIAGWNTERVQVCQVGQLLADLHEQEALMVKQQGQLNTLRAQLESFRRNDAGHRFAIGCLLVFALFQALLLLWVVLR
jgi:hypothetical protein